MRPPVLPPRPVAAGAVAAAAAAAFLAARPPVHAGAPPPSVVAALLVPAAAAAVAAVATTLLWPRFATETLGLHGTVLPSPTAGPDWPALGRARPLAAAASGKRLHRLVVAWQASVGWGRNFQVWLGGVRWVYVGDLADGRFLTQRLNPPRAPSIMRWFGELLTPRIVFLVGNEEHARVRALAHTALLTSATADTVTAAVGDLLLAGTPGSPAGSVRSHQGAALDAAVAAGEALDLDAWAVDVTLGVMFRVLFSETPPRAVVDGTRHAMSEWIDAMSVVTGAPIPAALSFGARRRIRAAGGWLADTFEAAVGRRRAAWADGSRGVPPPKGAREPPGAPRLDMLDVMLRDWDGGGIYAGDERRLYADLAMYLLGGHDTTAHSLAFAIHALTANPDVEARLLAEADAQLPPPPHTVTPRDLPHLPYLDAVWKETMRLFPIAALGTLRQLTGDTQLPSGARLPKGTLVTMPIITSHHNPEVFPRPAAFLPDRWMPGGVGGGAPPPPRAAWIPFQVGPRSCSGQLVAVTQFKAGLLSLLRAYRFQAAPPLPGGGEVWDASVMTLRPVNLRVIVQHRT